MSEPNANTNAKPFSLTDLLGFKAVSAKGDPISIANEWDNGKKKTIALYFSAHWCPPCRQFTPLLAKAYQENKEKTSLPDDDSFELVFVSSDSDEEAFKEYHRGEMTFPALDYNDSRDINKKLSEKFNVQGIPALVVLDAKTGLRLDDTTTTTTTTTEDEGQEDEKKVEEEGKEKRAEKEDSTGATAEKKVWPMSPRDMVSGYGSLAFPLSEESSKKCVDVAKTKQDKALEELLTLPNIILSPKLKSEVSGTYTFAKLLSEYKYVSLMIGSNYMLDELHKTFAVVNEVNQQEEDGKKLAVVYVPECFNPGNGDDFPKDDIKNLFHFNDKPSQDVIDTLIGVAGKVLSFDCMVTVQQGTRHVEERGLDGKCTSVTVPQVLVVSVDEYLSNSRYHGGKYFPWTPDLVEQAEQDEKAMVAKVKSKMEDSLEQFLLEQASEGNLMVGGTTDAAKAASSRLGALDDDGLVAFLFDSSSTDSLTTELVKCYSRVNQLAENQEKPNTTKLEVVYVPTACDKEAFDKAFAKMACDDTTGFMAISCEQKTLCRAMTQAFDIGWRDTIVLMKKDGTLISVEGGAQCAIEESSYYGFPWNKDSIAKGKEEINEAYKKRDEGYEQTQLELGLPIIRRLVGPARDAEQVPEERLFSMSQWSTFGVPTMTVTSETESNYAAGVRNGVFYYELEVLKLDYCSQVGFCAPNGLDSVDPSGSSDGCGDTKESWGVCGIRGEAWNDGEHKSLTLDAKWKAGDVIGLAVNVSAGKIAIATNGSEPKIVFHDENIKKGVFPCFSTGRSSLRLNTTAETFKHAGPSSAIWSQDAVV